MPVELTSTAFGCTVGLRVTSRGQVADALPFWWDDAPIDDPEHVVTIGPDVRASIGELELWVAEHSPDFTFVHAGVVGVDGAAIVLPGRSLSGKSTLVAELLRAGAQYGSDEYAVIDAAGLVHPYPRPISLRNPMRQLRVAETDVIPPSRVAAVLALRYDGANHGLQITELTPAATILALLDNTVCAATRPDFALNMLSEAVTAAQGWGGIRGQAVESTAALFALIKAG